MDKSIEKAIYILQSKFLSYKSQRRFDKARFGELAHAICGRPRTPALATHQALSETRTRKVQEAGKIRRFLLVGWKTNASLSTPIGPWQIFSDPLTNWKGKRRAKFEHDSPPFRSPLPYLSIHQSFFYQSDRKCIVLNFEILNLRRCSTWQHYSFWMCWFEN